MRPITLVAAALLVSGVAPALPLGVQPHLNVPIPCDALAPAADGQALACGAWVARAPLPAPREGLGAAWLPGANVVLAFGGRDASGALSGSLFAYAPASNTWTVRASGPPRADMVFVGGEGNQAYVFGGRTAAGAAADVWRYDHNADAWQQLPAPAGPAARYGAQGGWNTDRDKDNFLVFGGTDGARTFADLWSFKPAANAWTAQAAGPPGRAFAGSVWDPDRMALFVNGGVASDGALLADTWLFETLAINAGPWFAYPSQVTARAHHVGGWLQAHTNYASVGGATAAGLATEAWVLSPSVGLGMGAWFQQTSRPAGVRDAAGASVPASDTMYVVGGATAAGTTDAVWTFTAGATTYGG